MKQETGDNPPRQGRSPSRGGQAVSLKIPWPFSHDMIEHCRAAYPKEACGILAGSARDEALGEREVVQVYRMTNLEDSPIGYAMDPREQLAVDKQMRQRGQRMIGIYHSHTASAARPSPVDVSLAISPDISYALISLRDQRHPDVLSWRIEGTTVTPEPCSYEAAPGEWVRGVGTGKGAQV